MRSIILAGLQRRREAPAAPFHPPAWRNLRRSLLVALAVALLPAAAQAIERYNIDRMSCAQAQAIVQRDHAAILRYRSPRSGLILYDRYVADSRFCPAYTSAVRDYVRTADNPACPVYHCVHTDSLPGFLGRD